MEFKILNANDVRKIHNDVIHAYEIQGERQNASLDAVITRIVNRLYFGLITDIFDLSACYGVFIAIAHVFNDANKRTAFDCMDTVLVINDIELIYPAEKEAGNKIIDIVCHKINEFDLAKWLRSLPRVT